MLFSKLIEVNEEINELYKNEEEGYTVALIGNPNVGKSTVFNTLTGMKQHTGNWPGKTVSLASGTYAFQNKNNEMIDLPGTYSLLAHSKEEEVTRNYICFEKCDVCLVVCDATCLERNMNLVLQTMEITNHVVLCLNLIDEAERKEIHIDEKKLEKLLGVDVVKMSARNHIGFEELKQAIAHTARIQRFHTHEIVTYDPHLEAALKRIEAALCDESINKRFYALKLLDPQVDKEDYYLQLNGDREKVRIAVSEAIEELEEQGIYEHYEELIVKELSKKAKDIVDKCIMFNNAHYYERDLKIDRIVTHKIYGVLIMIALLSVIFWITISGANIPSQILSDAFGTMEGMLSNFLRTIGVSEWLHDILVLGVYKTTGWVVAVMLPPMAIFFPLFTLLEDFGYLPRIAFNLDGYFQKAKACGKQALTMCMGFGCNAVGVSGCRIIDSPRERLLAILTNNFVPCNGRFPTLIAIISMFFTGMFLAPWNGIVSTLILTSVILLGIWLTFRVSSLLSKTLLKGVPSSFTLELPPYRKPQFGKVIVRSVFDRTLFVLGRAISVAVPAGAFIWLLANVQIQDVTLLAHISSFLDPFARLLGLDGVILLAFILGFPANEIVVPIMIMAYMSNGYMIEFENLMELKELLLANGWTWVTAVCTMLFSLIHWPCATTCLTIRKETGSWKWTILSILIPTVIGCLVCAFVAAASRLLFL